MLTVLGDGVARLLMEAGEDPRDDAFRGLRGTAGRGTSHPRSTNKKPPARTIRGGPPATGFQKSLRGSGRIRVLGVSARGMGMGGNNRY